MSRVDFVVEFVKRRGGRKRGRIFPGELQRAREQKSEDVEGCWSTYPPPKKKKN